MPYDSTDDLPPGVRNNLPSHARKIYMHAFNSVHADTGSDESAARAGWGAVKKAGYRKIAGRWQRGTDRDEIRESVREAMRRG